jgi:hypothetical protein
MNKILSRLHVFALIRKSKVIPIVLVEKLGKASAAHLIEAMGHTHPQL